MSHVGLAEARAAAATFVGPIEQIPPMVSAVQIGGHRLHELARQGIDVERPARPVTVYRFDVGDRAEDGVFPISVECSSGTYVRALAADLGQALGGGAHLRHLRRTAIGSFSLAEARSLDALGAAGEAVASFVLSPAEALRDYASVVVDASVAADVGHGRPLERGRVGVEGDGPWPLVDAAGALLAVYEAGPSDQLVAAVVLASA
jgi:tRNA pseudouridine55 synthase